MSLELISRKRTFSEDLPNPTKRIKLTPQMEELAGRIAATIPQDLSIHKYGEALFNFIASHPTHPSIWEGVFLILGLPYQSMKFPSGPSFDLPQCLWSAHSQHLSSLVVSGMDVAAMEKQFGMKPTATFLICLQFCRSYSMLNKNNCQTLFHMARKYEVNWLVQDCVQFFCDHLHTLSYAEQKKMLAFSMEFRLFDLQRFFLLNFTIPEEEIDPLFDNKIRQLSSTFVQIESPLFQFAVVNPILKCVSLTLKHKDCTAHLFDLKQCLQGKASGFFYPIYLDIDDENYLGLMEIQDLFKNSVNLIGVDMTMNATSIQPFVEMVKNNPLKYLTLRSSIDLATSRIGDREVALLLNSLKNNPDLRQFQLADCEFGRKSARALIRFLKHHQNLEVLHITSSQIGSTMINALIDGCSQCLQLQELSLEGCMLAEKASLDLLIGTLKTHPSLNALYLGNVHSNRKEDHSIFTLCELISQSTTLQFLSVTDLTNDTVDHVLKAIRLSQSLTEMKFRNGNLNKAATLQTIYEIAEKKQIKFVFEEYTLGLIALEHYKAVQNKYLNRSVTFEPPLELI